MLGPPRQELSPPIDKSTTGHYQSLCIRLFSITGSSVSTYLSIYYFADKK